MASCTGGCILGVLSTIDKRGLHLSPEDRQWLESLRRKTGAGAG